MTRPRQQQRAVAAALLLATLGALLAPVASVRADAAAEARFWDELARRAYARRHYAEALGDFLAAHDAAPATRTLYNVALCASLVGEDALAYASFTEYLASADPDAVRRADAEGRRDALAHRLALVRVESDPPGATVWIDRRELGSYGTTPRTIVLSPGAHTVELERADHHPARVEVVAATGALREISARLDARTGRVRVDAPGAAVTLERDGESLALAEGREALAPVGAWLARASAPGRRDATTPVVVREGALEQRSLVLEPVPAPMGRLLVRTERVRARVTLDGEPRAETPTRLEVRAGEHAVAIEAPGYVRWAREVRLVEGGTLRLDVTLVPL